MFVLIDRIDSIATSGTLNDSVKLKANHILLNKVMPDLSRNEVIMAESPYDRIMREISKKEEEDGN